MAPRYARMLLHDVRMAEARSHTRHHLRVLLVDDPPGVDIDFVDGSTVITMRNSMGRATREKSAVREGGGDSGIDGGKAWTVARGDEAERARRKGPGSEWIAIARGRFRMKNNAERIDWRH